MTTELKISTPMEILVRQLAIRANILHALTHKNGDEGVLRNFVDVFESRDRDLEDTMRFFDERAAFPTVSDGKAIGINCSNVKSLLTEMIRSRVLWHSNK